MKKTVFHILLAVCVFLSVSAIAVSGKTEIAFTATATSAFTDGGYMRSEAVLHSATPETAP